VLLHKQSAHVGNEGLIVTERIRDCQNIKKSSDGFDGTRLTCEICGYDHRVDGIYFRWVGEPQPPAGDPCQTRLRTP
jgi:hypothetical protein